MSRAGEPAVGGPGRTDGWRTYAPGAKCGCQSAGRLAGLSWPGGGLQTSPPGPPAPEERIRRYPGAPGLCDIHSDAWLRGTPPVHPGCRRSAPGKQRTVAEQYVVDQPHVRWQRVMSPRPLPTSRHCRGRSPAQASRYKAGSTIRLARSPVAPKSTKTAGRAAGSGCYVIAATYPSYVPASPPSKITESTTSAVGRPGVQNLPPWMRRLRWDWPGSP
jgi:hypothetical protein